MSNVQASAPAQAFTRRATGVVREAKTRDAFYYNVMWSSVLLTFAFFWILYPFYYTGSNLLVTAAIAGALGLPGAFLYAILSHVMPRTGGDYVFNSRTLHPAVGFMANFSYCFWLAVVYGVYTTYIAAYGIGAWTRMIAGYTGSTGWVSSGDWFSTHWGLFITGSAMMLLSAVMFVVGGTRWFFRFQVMCFGLYVLSMLIVVVLGLTTSQAGFLANFDHYAANLGQSHAAVALDSAAKAGGYAVSQGLNLHTSLMAVSVLWFIFGFTYSSNYFAGEIRATKRAHLWSIPGAAILGVVAILVLGLAYSHFASYAFNAKLGFADPSKYGFASGAPAYPEISAIASGSAFWGTLILLGFTLGLIVWLPQTMVLISRSMFAWSFDRLMPEKLSYIDQRTRTPVVALAVITVLGIGSTAVYAFTTWFTTISVLLGLSITLLFTALSGIVLPYRRPQLFESSAFNQRIAGIPVLSIVASIALAAFGFVIWILLTDPGSGTSIAYNPGKLELAVIVYAAAGLIYLIAAAVRRRQGIDIRYAYQEIPPE